MNLKIYIFPGHIPSKGEIITLDETDQYLIVNNPHRTLRNILWEWITFGDYKANYLCKIKKITNL